MNKITKLFAVVCILGLGLVLPKSYALEPFAEYRLTTFEMLKLVGNQVNNPAGENLGYISDFIMDEGGRVVFTILYHGGNYKLGGGKYVAVPFNALDISKEKPKEFKIVLNIDKEKWETAPSFDRTAGLIERSYSEDIYRHFGRQPYWIEETKEEAAPAKSWYEDILFYAP